MADIVNPHGQNSTFGGELTNANGAIPVIFSKKLAVAYGTKGMGVTDNLTNDNYAGEIKDMGDRVRIVVPIVPADDAIAFSQLNKSGEGAETATGVCPVFQTVAPESLDLVIDRTATFGLAIDDVQKAQTQFKNWLDGQATAYGEKLKYLRNKQIANYIFEQADITSTSARHHYASEGLNAAGTAYEAKGGTLASPKTGITSQNIFTFLLKVKEALIVSGAVGMDGTYSFKPMEQEARDERAVIVVTPAMHTLIMSSYRVGGRSVEMADVVVKDGAVTRVAGMDIVIDKTLGELETQGLPFLAGTKNAITKAQQISKVEATRDPYCFRDLIKGIDLYGFKLVHPEALYRGCIAKVDPEEAIPTIQVTP